MAQMTGAISAKDSVIEYSTNGSSWTAISGYGNKLEDTSQARKTGYTYTFDGDTAIITVGKREPLKLKLSFVYSEGSSEPFQVLRALFEAGTALYLRWTAKAAVSGNRRFTTDLGYISEWPYPDINAESADAIMTQFTFETPKATDAAIP
mgnify:CR=1 FL=1